VAVEWFVGAGGVTDHDDDVVLGCDAGEGVLVVWVFFEEFFPNFFHGFFAFGGGSVAVYECVVICH